MKGIAFITIRNYITLKPWYLCILTVDTFITIRNYITLKLQAMAAAINDRVYHYQKLHHSQTKR